MRKWILILLAVILIWTIWGNTALEVNEWTVTSGEIPAAFDGFRIAQISDLHNAQFGDHNEKLLALLAQCRPDAIVITGDLVDSRNPNFDVAVEFAAQAVAIAPCYYVPGNHESRLDYALLRSRLLQEKVTVLDERAVTVRRGEEQIRILGIQDPAFYDGNDIDTLDKLVAGSDFEILLAHRPERMAHYADAGVDLVFSGHAHGGQFRLPVLGGFIAPNQGFFPEFDGGVYTESETTMFVSRGLGNSLFPVRFNNRPEILVCTLIRA